ncbi:hypothetical protein PC116_g2292 [Phytophthora cactorum]|nr:hypothetical protein PC116_g2292 [Phytophthora cactorum]
MKMDELSVLEFLADIELTNESLPGYLQLHRVIARCVDGLVSTKQRGRSGLQQINRKMRRSCSCRYHV